MTVQELIDLLAETNGDAEVQIKAYDVSTDTVDIDYVTETTTVSPGRPTPNIETIVMIS